MKGTLSSLILQLLTLTAWTAPISGPNCTRIPLKGPLNIRDEIASCTVPKTKAPDEMYIITIKPPCRLLEAEQEKYGKEMAEVLKIPYGGDTEMMFTFDMLYIFTSMSHDRACEVVKHPVVSSQSRSGSNCDASYSWIWFRLNQLDRVPGLTEQTAFQIWKSRHRSIVHTTLAVVASSFTA